MSDKFSYLDHAAYVFPHPPKSCWIDGFVPRPTWDQFSIYVHVPFCMQLCHFCHFEKRLPGKSSVRDYVRALHREIVFQSKRRRGEAVAVDAIYFGGGTASLLNTQVLIETLEALKASFRLDSDAEVTLECEPGTKSALDFQRLREAGFNRISVGLQAADDDVLRALNRRHSVADAVLMVESAARHFENIHVDLMYGLPGLGLDGWSRSVALSLALPITHFSAYPLYTFSNEPLDRLLRATKLPKPADRADYARMREYVLEVAVAQGFVPYSLTDFARPGFQSRYVAKSWNGRDYLGLGPSALSRNGLQIWENTPFTRKYSAAAQLSDIVGRGLELTPAQASAREVSTGLFGLVVDLAEVERRHGIPLSGTFGPTIDRLQAAGLVRLAGASLELTHAGQRQAMAVMRAFCSCDMSVDTAHLTPVFH